ncbi:hypothetical protein SNOG_06095 [Parastagonospora nodorum SN15]|uniref:Uncharacterized protein n=1 Tax=Phaeosphaeria nodorum (strain SN15 / ATCC MYA-4574 / FGSC 10173) TaxID=321614 RepID=Q0UQ69_PHANO|nr:hypothetical protein SNOG_06095 [Parastagonospora nodorum SN15]EAT87159.2 hypothetical protein SNOG_06095 [Parastagonospora nodorum SN15]
MEAIVKGQNEKNSQFPRIITCPNEMVALSMADGYARLTGKPQCVIVHVDVGTQGLGAAVHNASCGRAPVLIFAGLSPFTIEGEMRGSRTEYIHWIQDVPDQKQIVAQYCRYTGEIKSGKNVKQMVNRALSFAMSDPKGPVYLYGAREPMEEDLTPYKLELEYWQPVEPAALPPSGVKTIAEALVHAQEPLVIAGYTGRNHAAVEQLVQLADNVKGLRVLDTGGSDMCFPANHPAWLGLRYGNDPSIKSADVILVIDCDLNGYLESHLKEQLSSQMFVQRWSALQESHKQKLEAIAREAKLDDQGHFATPYLCSQLKKLCPNDTIWAIEAVTQTSFVADQIQATLPGSWINCGGGGLGWSGGGALGIKLATDTAGKKQFVCQIVGDGTYLFSVPGSVYWISQRYKIPILTIVLNNKGWNAPRRSMLLVHPDGEGSKVSNEELNISFAPTPDYSGIAKAASGGEIWAAHASNAEELGKLLPEAIQSVLGGRSAVLDAHLEGPEGKYGGGKGRLG